MRFLLVNLKVKDSCLLSCTRLDVDLLQLTLLIHYPFPLTWPISRNPIFAYCDLSNSKKYVRNARAWCSEGREFVSQRPAKSYTALQTVHHCFNIYVRSCVALTL